MMDTTDMLVEMLRADLPYTLEERDALMYRAARRIEELEAEVKRLKDGDYQQAGMGDK